MKITNNYNYINTILFELRNIFPKGRITHDSFVFEVPKIGKCDVTNAKGKNYDDIIDLIITGKTMIKAATSIKKLLDNQDNNKATSENIKNTPFSKIFNNLSEFGDLHTNFTLLQSLNHEFKKLKIKNINMRQTYSAVGTICKDLTLSINSSFSVLEINSYNKQSLGNMLFSKYEIRTDEDSFKSNFADYEYYCKPMKSETIKDIIMDDITVGKYYEQRNLIQLFYNPFVLEKIRLTGEITQSYKDLFKILKDLNLKKIDTSEIKNKLFTDSFLKTSRSELTKINNSISSLTTSIRDYEKGIRKCIDDLDNKHREKDFIETLLENDGNEMMKEIEKTKKLTFIKNIKIDNDSILFSFVPTTMNIPDLKLSGGNTCGKRTVYLGQLDIKVSPNSFTVKNNDCPIMNYHGGINAHPHVDANPGSPCFGSGDGRNKIYELRAKCLFSEMATMLWFWIKTYVDAGAYVKTRYTYIDRLKKGLPVWDKNGKRIYLGDDNDIKEGAQSTDLIKESCYDSNIEKFKNYKLK